MYKHARPASLSRRAAAWSASFRLLRASASVVVAVSAFVIVGTPRVQAQDNYTYTGTTGTAAAPTASTTFTGAFTDTTTGTPNTTPAATDNTLTFGGSASYAATDDIASLTLNGGLAFTNTAGTVTINAANGATIFGSGGAGSTLGFAVNTGVVVFNPAISLGASTLAFTGGGTGSQTTIGGIISGTGAMTDSIAGTLTLNSNNTYTGGTTVNSGSTLVLNSGGGSGAIRGAVTVNTGATLSLNVNNALGYTAGSQVTALNINGGTVSVAGNQGDEGFLTSFNLTGGTMAYAGTGAYQIAAGDATAPKITSNASATTSLISGGVGIRSGNLPIIVASGTTANGVDLQISGVISGGFPITKSGAGLLALSNFNTYTGGTTVNAGTLRLAAGGGSGAVQGAITVNSGATLNLSVGDAVGYGAGTSVTTINVNGGTVTSGNFNEGYLTSYNLTGGTVAAGGLFRFNVNAATPPTISSSASGATSFFNAGIDDFASGGATASSILTVNVATGTTANGIDLQIGGGIITNGGLAKTNTGYLNLTGQSSFTGPVNVTAGTLNIGTGAANNGSTGALGLSTGGKAITVSAGATLSGTAANWFGNNGNTGTLPAITVNGGTLSTTRYTTLGALVLNGATVTATSSDGTANGAVGIYQAFAFRGDVTVGGTAASSISSTNVTATSGGYHLGANTTFTVASTNGSTPGRPTGDLVVNAPLVNQSGDFGNAAGGLTKAGAGTMALTATNTYRGATTVSAGTLLISGSINNSPMVSVTAGALTLSNTAATVLGDTATLSLVSGTMFNLNAASGTSETIGNLVLDTTTEPAGTYTAAQLMALDPNVIFSSSSGETLTVTAVPEPATWFAGFLLVGVAIGSQRRKLSDWLYAVRG